MNGPVKPELLETPRLPAPTTAVEDDAFFKQIVPVIHLSSSSESDSSDDSSEDSDGGTRLGFFSGRGLKRVRGSPDGSCSKEKKKKPGDDFGVVLPLGFLESLPPEEPVPEFHASSSRPSVETAAEPPSMRGCKQFWKAGDYEGISTRDRSFAAGGMDHARVHPKFLHSNATSHKWALGAFAELLDNSLDEVCSGATYVKIDMLESKKSRSKMLLIEDDGGGMDPEKMRHCMSLGYSAKSKVPDTIGQYGNGFKTSTMRLGADVIVFSRCHGKDDISPTQSIGLLSYTFLRSTGKDDIIVPMLDYEKRGHEWNKMIRSSLADWSKNLETIVQWSPFANEAELLHQFNAMKDHGTRIIIYNLWEDDQGLLELDFDSDPHDIQLRGVNRDEKNIQMANKYPNSRHFLTYKHSLRSYASILYLRLPPRFRIILRGKDVEHHNIVNDMMLTQRITYRPQNCKDYNMAAVVTIGFVKDAKSHIDVQGFNVYHKNRLIKPFWRIWNPSGSDGRGVLGLLEANFVEPAHDKQGFERTTVLANLENRLIQMQKTYWSSNCHEIGYAPRGKSRTVDKGVDKDSSPDFDPRSQSANKPTPFTSKKPTSASDKGFTNIYGKQGGKGFSKSGNQTRDAPTRSKRGSRSSEPSSPLQDSDDEMQTARRANCTTPHSKQAKHFNSESDVRSELDACNLEQLKHEIASLKERLKKAEGETHLKLQQELQSEKERCKSLETELQEKNSKIEELSKEQETLIDIFAEERGRRDQEEDNLKKKLKEASDTNQNLLTKIAMLENMKAHGKR